MGVGMDNQRDKGYVRVIDQVDQVDQVGLGADTVPPGKLSRKAQQSGKKGTELIPLPP